MWDREREVKSGMRVFERRLEGGGWVGEPLSGRMCGCKKREKGEFQVCLGVVVRV